MSYNKNIIDIINAVSMSFIFTIILLVRRDFLKINREIERLNFIIDHNNKIHTYHFKEIEASYKSKIEDVEVKYNTDILAVNANIDRQIVIIISRQDEKIKEILKNICYLNDVINRMSPVKEQEF